MGNKTLNTAKENVKDEFYTSLSDIETELKHYKKHFKDKTILCNCDDPYESNFFKYFALNFNTFGLKKLICTCYDGSLVSGEQLSLFDVDDISPTKQKQAYKVEINEVVDYNHDGSIDLFDVEMLLKKRKKIVTLLNENGNYKSEECLKILDESDIVVTNPPFSEWIDFALTLVEHNKKFIIMGNMNSLHKKEIFPLIKNNKMWVGFGFNKTMEFRVPDYYEFSRVDELGNKYGKVPAICWFTNLDIKKRHEDLKLYKNYNESEYIKYDNFDGIDVPKLSEIPCDYFGNMGVPDTFLEFYNPEQFELLGLSTGDTAKAIGITKNYRGRTDLAFTDKLTGKHKCPFSRIVIRRKR